MRSACFIDISRSLKTLQGNWSDAEYEEAVRLHGQ